MKLHIIAIRDIKANVYFPPYAVPNIGAAIRDFADECGGGDKNKSLIAKHPEDFELYKVAEWDDATGSFATEKDREQLAVGSNYVR